MKKLIIISWLCIFIGAICSVLLLSPDNSLFDKLLLAAGYALFIAPNMIWIIKTNIITSKKLGLPSSKFMTGLAVFFFLGFFSIWFLMAIGLISNSPETNAEWPLSILNYLSPIVICTLFLSTILAATQLVNAEENPEIGRKSRIFVAFLGFFYIAIGMFFIAKRLGKIKLNITAPSETDGKQ